MLLDNLIQNFLLIFLFPKAENLQFLSSFHSYEIEISFPSELRKENYSLIAVDKGKKHES